MSDVIYSHSGVKLEVCATPQNTDLDDTAFALLAFVPVANVGMVGEYGLSTNMLTYPTWDTVVARKAKGITNAGDPPIEVARTDADPGQIILRTAGAPDAFDAYAFKVTKQDGAIDYIRGLVSGPVSPNGRNEDFDLHNYVVALNQAPVHVDAS